MISRTSKPEGFIVKAKISQGAQSTRRSFSQQAESITYHSTLNSQLQKSPGKIKGLQTKNQIYKIDQEMNYNADIYSKYQKPKYPIIKYEQTQSIGIQVRKGQAPKLTRWKNEQEDKKEEEKQELFHNIHGQFQLQKYYQIYHIIQQIISAININQIQVLKSLKSYIFFVVHSNIDDVSELKFIPNKRQLLKRAFAIEREAMMIVCFIIATNKFQSQKANCSNLLKYALQSFLITLNLLTQQNHELVQRLLQENQKQYLKGKGFEFIRSINQSMTSLIVKIARTDPLFAPQFCKIIQNYSNQSIRAQLYALMTFFAFYLHAIKAVDKVPFLSASPGPFILQEPTKQYTLVIDFMKVFMDSSLPLKKQMKKQQCHIRPYSQYFLNQMSKYFEIISFSDFLPIECNRIVSKIDEKKKVSFKLYKYHINPEVGKKQVQKIGRNLDRIILLDTVQCMKTDNLFLIHQWKGQSHDAILAQICPLLASIAVKNLSVIESIKRIKNSISKNAILGLKYINCGLNLQQ